MADIERLRNIAFVGPHHAGKTTLVEAILAHTGAIGRRGSISDGTTVTDHEPEDAAHLQSTTVGLAHTVADGVEITVVDTPGFIDFFEETKQALAGVDAAVVVVEADPGRVVQTQAIVDHLEATHMPHIFVINKMDRPGADFSQTLAALQNAYGRHVVAEQLPLGSAEQFEGYVDLAQMTAYRFGRRVGGWNPRRKARCDSRRAGRETARGLHVELLEAMADYDDRLMEELSKALNPRSRRSNAISATSALTIKSFRS